MARCRAERIRSSESQAPFSLAECSDEDEDEDEDVDRCTNRGEEQVENRQKGGDLFIEIQSAADGA